MEQTGKNAQEQKPKISRIAIASPLVVIIGFVAGLVSFGSIPEVLGIIIILVSPVVGLILGIIATWKIRKSKGALKGRIFSISGIVLGILVILAAFLPAPCSVRKSAKNVVCQRNLTALGKAIKAYSDRYNQKYPTPEIWCDLLIEYADVNEEDFVCPEALENGDKGRCHYAINPYCTPDSPDETVLLFETKGGWNKYGGPELLTTYLHQDFGINILYNDGYVEQVWTGKLSRLKWGGVNIGLDDSCELFIGKFLEVKPVYGWGWYGNKEAPEPSEGFKMCLKSLWKYDGIRRGGIAKIETKGHIYDGWTVIFNTRFPGAFNFTDKTGGYEILITKEDIIYIGDDGWPFPRNGYTDSCRGYCVIEACSPNQPEKDR